MEERERGLGLIRETLMSSLFGKGYLLLVSYENAVVRQQHVIKPRQRHDL